MTDTAKKVGPAKSKPAFGGNKSGEQGNRRPPFKRRFKRPGEVQDDFEQRLVDLARVTRVMAGGKRMKFRACMVVGDQKGQVGYAVAKGSDVSDAIGKAVGKAKKKLITVPIIDGTIPHEVHMKFKAAKLLIKPARKGSGIKAGGVVRIVLDLAGVKDVVGKILGSNNKVNNVVAILNALSSFKNSGNSSKIKPSSSVSSSTFTDATVLRQSETSRRQEAMADKKVLDDKEVKKEVSAQGESAVGEKEDKPKS